jgi:hypothetical protein
MASVHHRAAAVEPANRLKRFTPLPVPPIWSRHEAPAKVDQIPATVSRIRIVNRPEAGDYTRTADGWWKCDTGTHAEIPAAFTNRWYTDGRVAILPDPRPTAPTPDPRPSAIAPAPVSRPVIEPETAMPAADAEQWWSGYTLALQGIEALPPRDLPLKLRAAFLDGQYHGEQELDEILDDMMDAYGESIEESNREAYDEAMSGPDIRHA